MGTIKQSRHVMEVKMNDFTVVECSFCQTQRMRTNFSWCKDCNQLVCANTDVNCGIDCPCCEWFVCGACVIEHSTTCWKQSKEILIRETDQGTVYTFHQEEKTKLDDRITVFSNEYSITEIRIDKTCSEVKLSGAG